MANQTGGLTDFQQAILVFIALAIPAIGAWSALGFPTDKLALGALVAAILTGLVLALKEALGVTTPASAAPAPTATPATHAVKLPQALYQLKKRLIFLSLRK